MNYCEYLIDWMLPQMSGHEGYFPHCECGEPAGCKIRGKWYCEWHADSDPFPEDARGNAGG